MEWERSFGWKGEGKAVELMWISWREGEMIGEGTGEGTSENGCGKCCVLWGCNREVRTDGWVNRHDQSAARINLLIIVTGDFHLWPSSFHSESRELEHGKTFSVVTWVHIAKKFNLLHKQTYFISRSDFISTYISWFQMWNEVKSQAWEVGSLAGLIEEAPILPGRGCFPIKFGG